MRVGFNYPWSFNRFGADFGPNPFVDIKQWLYEKKLAQQNKTSSIPLPPMFTHIDRNLYNLKQMGIEVVRFFILANGFTYSGIGPTRRNTPSPNPMVPFFDWNFVPFLVTDPRFIFHFNELLKRFKKINMQIIPSLISFEFGGNSARPDAKGLAPGGRSDCIKDKNKHQIFLSTILNDLLKVSQNFKEQIFAWEVINEPYWNVSPLGPLSNIQIKFPSPGSPPQLAGFARIPEVSTDEMNEFLLEATQLIESKGHASTVGHRFFWNINPKESVHFITGNKPQFHYYAKPTFGFGDPLQIKGQKLFTGNPKPFLGEFDSDLNRFGKPWPELQGQDTTLNRLLLLKDEGCELALLWPDLGAPGQLSEIKHVVESDPIKLVESTRRAIINFTQGVLPPANE